MAEGTIAGAPIIAATITMPGAGAWLAHVSADTDEVISGSVTIDIAGAQFVGTVMRGGVIHGRLELAVCGGAYGLPTVLAAQSYRNVPASIPLKDILSACGETLSSTHDASKLAIFLPAWMRIESRGGQAMQMLLDKIAANWRVLADGTVWIGADTWPTQEVDAVVLDEFPARKLLHVQTEQPTIRPGVTWEGRRVSYVQHKLSSARSSTEVWYE
jgi:hypothetical protein